MNYEIIDPENKIMFCTSVGMDEAKKDKAHFDKRYRIKCDIVPVESIHQNTFNKHFERVEPKKMITFLDLFRKGKLYAFDLIDGSDFLLDESNEERVLFLINSPNFIFGTLKEKKEEGKGNIYFLFGERACKFIDENNILTFVEEYDGEGYGLWCHDHNEFSVIDFANAMNGYLDFSIVTKTEFKKLSEIQRKF